MPATAKGRNDIRGGSSTDESGKTDHFQLLYRAMIGPDSEGKAKPPVDTVVSLPAAHERIVVSGQVVGRVSRRRARDAQVQRCGEDTPYWGCALLLVP